MGNYAGLRSDLAQPDKLSLGEAVWFPAVLPFASVGARCSGSPWQQTLFIAQGAGFIDPARGRGVSECSLPQAKILRGGSMTRFSDRVSTADCLRIWWHWVR